MTHRDIKTELQNTPGDLFGITKHEELITPSWIMNININFILSVLPKYKTLPSTYKSELQSILEYYKEYTMLSTNGLKTEDGVGTSGIQ